MRIGSMGYKRAVVFLLCIIVGCLKALRSPEISEFAVTGSNPIYLYITLTLLGFAIARIWHDIRNLLCGILLATGSSLLVFGMATIATLRPTGLPWDIIGGQIFLRFVAQIPAFIIFMGVGIALQGVMSRSA